LVLVSEQRINAPQRPTVAAQDEEDDEDDLGAPNIFAASGEFTEFGQLVAARTPAEWMEAAAAHIMLKDGFDSFTRPQLMGRLLSHPPIAEMLDREQRLAQFGALLRDGRLVRARRGQFALPEGSRLLDQARKLAG
jgi:hypothetical protein